MDYRYQYDAVGNITEKQTEHGPYRYEYDNVDRLTVADYPNGPTNDQINESMAPNTFPFADDRYTYDLLGNRLTDQRQTQATLWQYNQNNELLNSGFNTYAYNASGSTTAKNDPTTSQPIQSYAYNTEERMEEVRDDQGNLVAEYYYDPFGRRLWKTLYPGAEGHPGESEAVREYLAYSDEGYAAETLPAPNSPAIPHIRLSLFAPSGTWSTEPLLLKGSSGVDYLQHDHLGTPVAAVVAGSGAFKTRRNAAFGGSAGESLTELRFPGQYFDQEIGQSYNFARSYSDATARYQQADPLNITDGPNFYSYAHQSPNRYVDPEGGVAGAAIGAAGRAVGSGLALGAQLCVRNARCRSAAMNAASAAVSSVTRLLYRTCYLYEIRGEGCVDNRIVYIGITSQMDPEARCNQSHPAIRWIQPVCPNCKLKCQVQPETYSNRIHCSAQEAFRIFTERPFGNTLLNPDPLPTRVSKMIDWKNNNCLFC